jgi:DNA-binding IclR family transcriptional regulator
MARSNPSSARRLVTVERAFQVLDILASSPSGLGTGEISRLTGINASTVSRLLHTLAAQEAVQRSEATGRYRLGRRLVHLGSTALTGTDLRERARPHLETLVRATGETATLSVSGEDAAITVDFVQSPSSVQSVARIGRPGVPHATATGKVYLAWGGTLPAGPLLAFTERTVTGRDELAAEVERTRERCWAEAVGEREPDLNAIAAPVLDARGELEAIVGLQGPAARFGRRAMRAAAEVLLGHAREMSP